MNSVSAKVILDSVSPQGVRLTTLQLRYPRMIHSEFMTHRAFSRNGRSSRAVPTATLLKEEAYVPNFMKNQPGMQSYEELDEAHKREAEYTWNRLVDQTRSAVKRLNELGVHKQWANRPLEWFGYIDVLVSSTDWANFIALRDEVGAQPEIDALGKEIRIALEESTPFELKHDEWHLPYVLEVELERYGLEVAKKVSVARCARLSYKPFDGDGSIEKELDRFDKLMTSRPVHASPAEHIATPDRKLYEYHDAGIGGLEYEEEIGWQCPDQHGNFYGWRQFRKMIPHNTVYDQR